MSNIPTTVNASGISSCKLSSNTIATSLHVDAELIAVTLNNGSIHLFQPNGKHITELKAEKPVCLWSLAVKDTVLIAGGIDGNLQVWDLARRKFVRSLKGHTDTIRSIHIPDPLSTAISGSKDGRIIIWDLKLGKHTAILKHESQDAIRTIALKHDAAFAGTYAGKLIRWDLSTRQCRSVLNAHDGVVYAIVVGDEEVFTAGSDGSIVSWDLETSTQNKRVNAHNGPISILRPTDRGLISTGFNGVITSWSHDLTKLWSVKAHTGSVTCLSFNSQIVITGGVDGKVKVLDLKEGESRDDVLEGVESVWKVAVFGDRVMVVGREGGDATVWTVPLRSLK